ncbi:MAG: hypothetical protein ACKO6N_24995 [Myxococcota bacterium]
MSGINTLLQAFLSLKDGLGAGWTVLLALLSFVAVLAPYAFAYLQRRELHQVYESTLLHKEREIERLVKERDLLWERLFQVDVKVLPVGSRSKAAVLKSAEVSPEAPSDSRRS